MDLIRKRTVYLLEVLLRGLEVRLDCANDARDT